MNELELPFYKIGSTTINLSAVGVVGELKLKWGNEEYGEYVFYIDGVLIELSFMPVEQADKQYSDFMESWKSVVIKKVRYDSTERKLEPDL